MCFDNFFDDLEAEDFAIIGGMVGYLEEEIEERKQIENEIEEGEQIKEEDWEDLIP